MLLLTAKIEVLQVFWLILCNCLGPACKEQAMSTYLGFRTYVGSRIPRVYFFLIDGQKEALYACMLKSLSWTETYCMHRKPRCFKGGYGWFLFGIGAYKWMKRSHEDLHNETNYIINFLCACQSSHIRDLVNLVALLQNRKRVYYHFQISMGRDIETPFDEIYSYKNKGVFEQFSGLVVG